MNFFSLQCKKNRDAQGQALHIPGHKASNIPGHKASNIPGHESGNIPGHGASNIQEDCLFLRLFTQNRRVAAPPETEQTPETEQPPRQNKPPRQSGFEPESA